MMFSLCYQVLVPQIISPANTRKRRGAFSGRRHDRLERERLKVHTKSVSLSTRKITAQNMRDVGAAGNSCRYCCRYDILLDAHQIDSPYCFAAPRTQPARDIGVHVITLQANKKQKCPHW